MTRDELQAVVNVVRTTTLDHTTREDMVGRLAERLNALDPNFEPGIFATSCGLDEHEARVVLARCGN